MPPDTATDLLRTAHAPCITPDLLQARLAEAASHAVLQRIAPALRHDVAGVMQPVGMLMLVLQRRVSMPEPDLQTIAKSVVSVSALFKEATTACMNLMGWMVSREDIRVSLHAGVDEVVHLLALELSRCGLSVASDIAAGRAEHDAPVPRRFFRSVLTAALLAWCDQTAGAGVLRMTGSCDANGVVLKLQFEAAGSAPPEDAVSPQRRIDWGDVEAMAKSFNVKLARGDGWLTLDLPAD